MVSPRQFDYRSLELRRESGRSSGRIMVTGQLITLINEMFGLNLSMDRYSATFSAPIE